MSIEKLRQGNERFREIADRDGLRELSAGQSPYACVITCSDSRMSPEIIFGAGLGDIFVIRTAGNTASDPMTLGSIEYAVEHLGVPAVVVLGHTGCGAVNAAMCDATPEGHLGTLVETVRGAAGGEGTADEKARACALRQVENIKAGSDVVRKAVDEGRTGLTAAMYDLADGGVTFL